MMVKICGVTNREDALAAVDAGASAIGLNFCRQSPRYLSPADAANIAGVLPNGILKVGVFVDEAPETIARMAREAGLDVVQIHGSARCSTLPVWRAVPIQNAIDANLFGDSEAEAFLLDTASSKLHGGTGQTFPWLIARDAGHLTTRKIIVAGGLDESNVRTAILEARPWGVDVCSRIESAPGRKDHSKMTRFIKAALTAEKS